MEPDVDFRVGAATSDFGFLVLRLGAGATLVQAGLIKALGFGATVDFMEAGGWRAATLAALMVTVAETLSGVALILGILAPLAACVAAAAMMDAWAATVSGSAFWSNPFDVPFLIAMAAIALLFTGAGRLSLDHLLWARAQWPGLVSVVLLIVAVAAAVATWALLNGVNPLHLTAPTG
ncbi:DoxX family protein [Mycolicibacterium mengxianglii]|uniref:DoxX family protein n=1 Tax=Mycolicibacterium mengxianglii TaxID=2736649 RepID=UPI0018D13057|nr:DoxX family protein [Mycolicibacterium mengxianglii]